MARKASFSSTKWRLHGARLGSFLANARAIRDLADDARSKYEGDFVFDRQYVVTVIERTLERIDGLLFDARVLGADTRSLDRLAARCKAAGRELSASSTDLTAASNGERDDPAYALLVRCSEWLDGAADGDGQCAMELVRRVTDAVAEAVDADRDLEIASAIPELELPGAAGRLRVADLGGGAETGGRRELSVRDLRCRPLGILLMGAAEVAAEQSGRSDSRWLAVVDRRHLSLRCERSDARFLCEATLTGESRTDWVFVYSSLGDPPRLPGGRSEATGSGWVLWQSGDGSVEELLFALGARLLGSSDERASG